VHAGPRLVAWAAVAPAAVALFVIVGLPLAHGVRISLSNWPGVGAINFTGFENYATVITNPAIVQSIGVTLLFAVGSTIGIVSLASVLAAAVSRGVRGAGFYKVVWFLPGVAPIIASALFWSQSMQPGTGAINYVLGAVGLGSDHAWLADPDQALYPIIAVTIWASTGFAFLLILGAMEQVPVELYEASALDGASPARQFFSVTFPMIVPVFSAVTLLQFIGAANNFGVVWAMTQGGPGDATTTLPALVYKQAFVSGDYGLAAAIAVVSGIVLIGIGLIGLRLGRSRQEEIS
jgi:ABC-type sugar transport system permease subunit